MKRFFFFTTLSIISLIACANGFIGYWQGDVFNIPTVFHIFNKSGEIASTISSPTQGTFDYPCDETVISGDSISIKVSAFNIEFCGTMQTDGKSITGTFTQGLSLKITLKPTTAEAAIPPRPQTPKPPFIYNSREVSFTHDDITLTGTLTTPAYNFGGAPPAVVLVTGSGTQNRDEEISSHKPFAVIADYLTRAGIAVLRYDDRGAGGSTQGNSDDTTFDYMTDAVEAIKFLKQQPGIDTTRVGILGHSEGGTIALITAATHPDKIAFAISLAGVAVKGRDAMIEQNRMISMAVGNTITAELDQNIVNLFNAIDTISDTTKLCDTLRHIMTKTGLTTQQIDKSITTMTSPWYTTFIRLDVSKFLPQIKCPLLALNGEWDMQVSSSQNLNAIKQALPHATTKEYPRLNHMFQESHSISQSLNYGMITQTISPQVLSDITNFILKLSPKR